MNGARLPLRGVDRVNWVPISMVQQTDPSDADLLAQLGRRLARTAAAPADWVTAYLDGDALRTDEAAFIAGVSTETVRRHCDAAADVGEPLGIHVASIWLVSQKRWLADIERRKGPLERRVAENRCKETA